MGTLTPYSSNREASPVLVNSTGCFILFFPYDQQQKGDLCIGAPPSEFTLSFWFYRFCFQILQEGSSQRSVSWCFLHSCQKGCLVLSSLQTSVSRWLDREPHGKVEKVLGLGFYKTELGTNTMSPTHQLVHLGWVAEPLQASIFFIYKVGIIVFTSKGCRWIKYGKADCSYKVVIHILILAVARQPSNSAQQLFSGSFFLHGYLLCLPKSIFKRPAFSIMMSHT